MSDEKKAHLDVIDDTLGFDENVTFDVLALLYDPGGGLKKTEAEGRLSSLIGGSSSVHEVPFLRTLALQGTGSDGR